MAYSNEARPLLEKSTCNTKNKVRVLDAVIHSKVLYGMETLVISQAGYDNIDAFQVRIFRKTLSPKTFILGTCNKRRCNEHC